MVLFSVALIALAKELTLVAVVAHLVMIGVTPCALENVEDAKVTVLIVLVPPNTRKVSSFLFVF